MRESMRFPRQSEVGRASMSPSISRERIEWHPLVLYQVKSESVLYACGLVQVVLAYTVYRNIKA